MWWLKAFAKVWNPVSDPAMYRCSWRVILTLPRMELQISPSEHRLRIGATLAKYANIHPLTWQVKLSPLIQSLLTWLVHFHSRRSCSCVQITKHWASGGEAVTCQVVSRTRYRIYTNIR